MLALDHAIFSLQAAGGISKWWLMHTLCMAERFGPSVLHLGPYSNHNVLLGEVRAGRMPVSRGKLSWFWPWRPVHLPETARVFHSSYLRTCQRGSNVASVFTFHDDVWLNDNSLTSRLKRSCVERCLRRARIVHCVSSFSKSRLLRRFPWVPEERIRVVYHGVTPPGNSSGKIETSVAGQFVLWVGNRHHYKNGGIAFEAAARLPDTRLVCVGGEPLSADEHGTIERLGLTPRFHHFPEAPTGMLNWLYANATALWYPSLIEGFGLPVIEAAARGCPVLGASGHAVEEIGRGWPILTAQPSGEWLAAMTELLRHDPTLRARLASEGIGLARQYTWERYTSEMAGLYAEART